MSLLWHKGIAVVNLLQPMCWHCREAEIQPRPVRYRNTVSGETYYGFTNFCSVACEKAYCAAQENLYPNATYWVEETQLDNGKRPEEDRRG